MRLPYPLQWPENWPRTKALSRQKARFAAGLAWARDGLLVELDRLGAANYIITSDLPVRADGLPYADGRSTDPGIATWFVLDDVERVFACDKWLHHADNMRAIALSIEAMRGLERWGMADVVQRAFSGFAALPAGAPGPSAPPPRPRARPWREVLGLATRDFLSLTIADQLALAKARYRELIKKSHPDVGGSSELAAEINNAFAEAERDLGAHA